MQISEERVLWRAWHDSLAFFGWNKKTFILAPLLYGMGLGLYALWQGGQAMTEEIIVLICFGLAPIGAFVIALFTFNLIAAPYRIEREKHKATLVLLEEQLAGRKMQIEEAISGDMGQTSLKIGAKVEALGRVTASDVMLCQGTEEGNIKALIEAVFDPANPPLKISRIALEVWGIQLETPFPPNLICKGSSWRGFFEIPHEFEKGDTKARLVVDIGSERYHSSEFSIPFETIGEDEA